MRPPLPRAGAATPTTPLLAVVLHDVAPATWKACQRVQRCVQSLAPAGTSLPMTMLVVPRYHAPLHGPDRGGAAAPLFERWLQVGLARGDELALHGCTHLDPGTPRGLRDHVRRRWYTAGEGEFCALSHSEAAERLAVGRQWFAERGWPLDGFVAPAWLLSEGSWEAVAAAGFSYTATLSTLVALPGRDTHTSQSLVYSTRAAWRRALSVPWNAAVARRGRAQPLLRFELHPWDADHAAVRDAWMGLLAQALQRRRAVTLRHAVAALCSSADRRGAGDGPRGAASA